MRLAKSETPSDASPRTTSMMISLESGLAARELPANVITVLGSPEGTVPVTVAPSETLVPVPPVAVTCW
jgi:hypothetical protein